MTYKLTNSGRVLVLKNQGLTGFPSLTSKINVRKITNIDASNNVIKEVGANDLKKYVNLISLNLSHNQISKIDKSAFSNNKRLENIDMTYNNLRSVDDFLDITTPIRQLKVLKMKGNPFVPGISKDPKVKNLDYQRLRLYIIFNLPDISQLDEVVINKTEKSNAERTGEYCRVNRIEIPDTKITEPNIEEEGEEDRKRIRSYFGYTKKEYIGLNSQGNRFIKDL